MYITRKDALCTRYMSDGPTLPFRSPKRISILQYASCNGEKNKRLLFMFPFSRRITKKDAVKKKHVVTHGVWKVTLPPIIREVKKWVQQIRVTFQTEPFFTSMIMGGRVSSSTGAGFLHQQHPEARGNSFDVEDSFLGLRFLTSIHCHLSHEKNPYYFPLYWLVNRDPYNGLL